MVNKRKSRAKPPERRKSKIKQSLSAAHLLDAGETELSSATVDHHVKANTPDPETHSVTTKAVARAALELLAVQRRLLRYRAKHVQRVDLPRPVGPEKDLYKWHPMRSDLSKQEDADHWLTGIIFRGRNLSELLKLVQESLTNLDRAYPGILRRDRSGEWHKGRPKNHDADYVLQIITARERPSVDVPTVDEAAKMIGVSKAGVRNRLLRLRRQLR